jgi:hypothetical protein
LGWAGCRLCAVTARGGRRPRSGRAGLLLVACCLRAVPLASRCCGRRPRDVASTCTLPPPPSLCLAVVLRCAALCARRPAVRSSRSRGSAAAALIFRSGSTCLAKPIPLPLAPLFPGSARVASVPDPASLLAGQWPPCAPHPPVRRGNDFGADPPLTVFGSRFRTACSAWRCHFGQIHLARCFAGLCLSCSSSPRSNSSTAEP